MTDPVNELTQREKDIIARRKAARSSGRLKPRRGNTAKKAPKTAPGGKSGDDLIMQLRKAQDVGGKYDIAVGSKSVRLNKSQIDGLLDIYNALDRPEQRSKFTANLERKLKAQ